MDKGKLMENRFGTDLILNEDGDFVFNNNGDLMTTQDYENMRGDAPFVGYYSVLRALSNLLLTDEGEYPFDPGFGAGLNGAISKNITPEYKVKLQQSVAGMLKSDSRVESVISVSVEVVGGSIVVIGAKIKLVGNETVAEYVFPEMFIP
jgi:phage baseplate assembly protein W